MTAPDRQVTGSTFRSERGFTLIELLVVILIIGILAAIAIPVLARQQRQALDAQAKSNNRNMVSHIESCYAETGDYNLCNEASELGDTGFQIGGDGTWGSGQVYIFGVSTRAYTVRTISKSGNVFYSSRGPDWYSQRDPNGSITRQCYSPRGQYPDGGCKSEYTAGGW